jgi:hypothetical protein
MVTSNGDPAEALRIGGQGERRSLYEVLAVHFAPCTLEQLVVTRREFPHWMR